MNEDGGNWYERPAMGTYRTKQYDPLLSHFGKVQARAKHQAEEKTPRLQLRRDSPSGPPRPYVTAKRRDFWKAPQPLRAAHRRRRSAKLRDGAGATAPASSVADPEAVQGEREAETREGRRRRREWGRGGPARSGPKWLSSFCAGSGGPEKGLCGGVGRAGRPRRGRP